MTLLKSLEFAGCGLSGTIPTEIGLVGISQVPNNLVLNIERNRFEGSIPEELYDIPALSRLGLGINSLTGTLSSRIGLFSQLFFFDVSDNDLSGTLPEEIFNLDKLKYLHIDGNTRLTGSIPEQFCSQKFQHKEVHADCLSPTETELAIIRCPEGCCARCCNAGLCKEM